MSYEEVGFWSTGEEHVARCSLFPSPSRMKLHCMASPELEGDDLGGGRLTDARRPRHEHGLLAVVQLLAAGLGAGGGGEVPVRWWWGDGRRMLM